MRWRLSIASMITTLLGVGAGSQSLRAPAIAAFTALSAHPATLAEGKSGPINRYAFDLTGFVDDGSQSVFCEYPGFAYRCAHEFSGATGGLERVIVAIPDLGRGTEVRVRFTNRAGTASAAVQITNLPRLLHEIESVALAGGAVRTGGEGTAAAVLQFDEQIASTVPALAAPGPHADPACDRIFAEWRSATATNPVFESEFGALHGGVTAAVPVRRGARVNPDNLPQWRITYPRSATRVLFIAHYEVMFRVGICAAWIVDQ